MNHVDRLIRQFMPSKYEIFLNPSRKNHSASGNIFITGQKVGNSPTIRLHSKHLKINNIYINGVACKFLLDPKLDELIINTKNNGEVEIKIEFISRIKLSVSGMYYCNYKEDKIKKTLIATQCESHHAREIFPCIDEPEAKAIFELTIRHDSKDIALFNTEQKESRPIGNRVETSFMPTPRMSTYLFAFVIGELSFTESITKRGISVKCYSTKNRVQDTKFAAKIGARFLDLYENYFGIEYPLTKCDLVALPDFSAAAMENWGLITYRDSELLYNPKTSSLDTKQSIVVVTAHEIAHQWFGNLVTMRWWDDLWLNEGFASFMETYMSNILFPEWNLWEQFLSDRRIRALKADSIKNTHPVVVSVEHPDEIPNIFDSVSYDKGACVLVMLHKYLGEKLFKKGLRAYLTRYAYMNATTKDLWDVLSEISNKDISAFMNPWISQKGYPLVSVRRLDNKIILSQQPFKYTPSKNIDYVWPVLIDNKDELFKSRSISIDEKNWRINASQIGYYRTAYSKKLLDKINIHKVSQSELLGLVSDSFESSKSGASKIYVPLNFIENASKVANFSSWEVIAVELGHTRTVFENIENKQSFKRLYYRVSKDIVENLGWNKRPDESHTDSLLRPLILALASYGENSDVINRALDIFDKSTSPSDIPADVRSVVYGTAARVKNDLKTFNKLLYWHKNSLSAEEKDELIPALTSFQSELLIEKVLNLIKTDLVRNQDIVYWILYLLSNSAAKYSSWLWIKNNWEWLKEQLEGEIYYGSLPFYIARNFANDEVLFEYNNFFISKKNEPALKKSIVQGRETITWQREWKKREEINLLKYFANYQ